MGMDKYGCFIQYVYYETIANIKHEEQTYFIGHICFSKNLFMSIRNMKKTGTHYFSFFALSNLLTQICSHFRTTGQLTSFEHAKCIYIRGGHRLIFLI